MMEIEALVYELARAVLAACEVERGSVAAFFYGWQTLISVWVWRQIRFQQAQASTQRAQIEKEANRKVKAAPISALFLAHPKRP